MRRPSRIVPIAGAIAGAAIGLVALRYGGGDGLATARALLAGAGEPSFAGLGAVGILGLGLVFGLKHATEADHVVAVSTIVSEHRQVRRAALVGALWGVGHTASLVAVGVVVLTLRIAIPESVAGWLELGVALMIVGLGANAVRRGWRGRATVHVHHHAHDGVAHTHLHFHEAGSSGSHGASSHAVSRIGLKPVLVGAVHGLAGSAALTLLILAQIDAPLLGLLYLAVFGAGSIAGMLAMSGLIGLPFALTSQAVASRHHALQIAAGVFSVLFGLWYAIESSRAVLAAFASAG